MSVNGSPSKSTTNSGQVMTGVKMDVRMLLRKVEQGKSELPTSYVSGKLEEMSSHIDTTIRSIRRIATELRPAILDDFGLLAAIEWQVSEFERKTEIKCTLLNVRRRFRV